MRSLFVFNKFSMTLSLILLLNLGCQEDPPTPPTEAEQEPAISTQETASVVETNPTPKLTPSSDNLQGTVVDIQDNVYSLQNRTGEIFTVTPTDSVLVDESLKKGDEAEVQYSEVGQPIAVRKIRDAGTTSETHSNNQAQERLIEGTVHRIDKVNGIYILKEDTDKEIKFKANANTLIDESIAVGDLVAVSLAENQDPIAIRLVRPQK